MCRAYASPVKLPRAFPHAGLTRIKEARANAEIWPQTITFLSCGRRVKIVSPRYWSQPISRVMIAHVCHLSELDYMIIQLALFTFQWNRLTIHPTAAFASNLQFPNADEISHMSNAIDDLVAEFQYAREQQSDLGDVHAWSAEGFAWRLTDPYGSLTFRLVTSDRLWNGWALCEFL